MRPIGMAGFLFAAVVAGTAASPRPPRQFLSGPTHRPEAPYSDAVLAGDTLYLAGKIGRDPATGKPPADAAAEARLVLDSVKETLALAGLSMDDLVSVQVFCSDVSLYDTFNGVYRGYFGKEMPARAFIGSGPLLYWARFEVQAIAVRR